MKPTLLALRNLFGDEMDELEERYDVIRLWEHPMPEDVIADNAAKIQGIVSGVNTPVTDRLISALPNLEIIAQFAVGFDNIDLDCAARRDVVVTNTPNVVTADTADVALFLMLTVMRRAIEADMYVRVGRWESGAFSGSTSVTGKTVGLLGMGRIGQAIAKRAAAFDTTIIYHARSEKDVPYTYYDDLEAMARDCDVLICACTGGEGTHHIVNHTILKALGRKGYLINIARGSVVDEEALLIALRNQDIAGAGLDVYAHEPFVPHEMFKMDNVVLSPHVGSQTHETRSIMGRLVLDNLHAHFSGQPLLTPVIKDKS